MKRLARILLGSKHAVVIGIVAVLNAVHPFIHAFEGGGFDLLLVNLDMVLMQIDPYIPWHAHDHCDGHEAEAVAPVAVVA